MFTTGDLQSNLTHADKYGWHPDGSGRRLINLSLWQEMCRMKRTSATGDPTTAKHMPQWKAATYLDWRQHPACIFIFIHQIPIRVAIQLPCQNGNCFFILEG